MCVCVYMGVEFNKICDALKQVLNLSQLTYSTLTTFNVLISATRYSAISDQKCFATEQTRLEKARVLVHCMSGQNRSGSLLSSLYNL